MRASCRISSPYRAAPRRMPRGATPRGAEMSPDPPRRSVDDMQLVEPEDLPDVAVRIGEAAGVTGAVLLGGRPRGTAPSESLRDQVVDLRAVLHREAGQRRGTRRLAGLCADHLGEPLAGLQRDDDGLV